MSPAAQPPSDDAVTLIDELLAEQRSLTAVTRFFRLHERQTIPAQARYYRDLIPLSAPGAGEQYAFEVDLDQCTGCKGCVTACHALNGLDDQESWRNVGLLTGGIIGHAVQQTVTTACHHCVDPGCLNGCPVLAYEKDPLTGIVRHLDDQCIGCQYCVMKCPYDVPKYSERLGIVRKCDLCHQRLAEGEAPACVQACPNGAIKITVVNRDDIARKYRQPETTEARGFAEPDFGELAASLSEPGCTNRFLPGSPEPAYTLPTTRFKSRNPQVAALHAANEAVLKPEHAHWPLVFLLVLSQLSVGLLLAGGLLTIGTGQTDAAAPPPAAGHPVLVFGAAMAMALALGLATLHLGRPLKAWRAFLGWRRSWFSREAIAFGGYMGALALTALAAGFPPMMQLAADSPANGFAVTALAWSLPLALALGAVSIFCSFMLYVDTRREFWAAYPTGVRFFGSTLLFAAGGWLLVDPSPNGWLTLIAVALTKLLLESTVLRHHNAPDWTPLKRTARLILGPLRPIAGFRVTALLFAGVAFPLLGLLGMVPPDSGLAALVLSGLVAGELAERHLFFTAVSPTQMPKGISA